MVVEKRGYLILFNCQGVAEMKTVGTCVNVPSIRMVSKQYEPKIENLHRPVLEARGIVNQGSDNIY